MPISKSMNCDCMEFMKTLPDNFFDLACVDPPYGDGLHADGGGGKGWFTKYNQRYQNDNEQEPPRKLRFHGGSKNPNDPWNKYLENRPAAIQWDIAPDKEYFDELFRVSKNQIIWGGNYFDLPPTRCFLVWRKLTISEGFSMAMAEYAWTSFKDNAKVFDFAPQGDKKDPRFHPTQKPVELYEWIFKNFAKPGDKIFDSHMGSQSSRIAAWKGNYDFYGCEIDENYFKKGEERFSRIESQTSLFLNMEEQKIW